MKKNLITVLLVILIILQLSFVILSVSLLLAEFTKTDQSDFMAVLAVISLISAFNMWLTCDTLRDHIIEERNL